MTKSRWFKLSIGIALILAAFGVVAWQSLTLPITQNVALAQAAPTATPTSAPQPAARPNAAPTVTTSTIGDTFWRGLAAKLGVNVDTLKADAVQVRKDMIDQAVKDGRATQAEATQIEQNLDANKLIAPIAVGRGTGQPGQRPQGPGRGIGFDLSTGVIEAVAKALNLSPSDLVTQLRGGKSLADIAQAQKVDQAKVKQAIIDARGAEIDRQVADGLITQAQATTLKSHLTPDNIDLTHTPFFFRSK